MYEYKCKLIRVIDGNTIEANIDLGFGIYIVQKIKLFGVPASNITADESILAIEKAKLQHLISKEFFVQTIYNKRGKIGRIFANVFVEDNNQLRININEELIKAAKNI